MLVSSACAFVPQPWVKDVSVWLFVQFRGSLSDWIPTTSSQCCASLCWNWTEWKKTVLDITFGLGSTHLNQEEIRMFSLWAFLSSIQVNYAVSTTSWLHGRRRGRQTLWWRRLYWWDVKRSLEMENDLNVWNISVQIIHRIARIHCTNIVRVSVDVPCFMKTNMYIVYKDRQRSTQSVANQTAKTIKMHMR